MSRAPARQPWQTPTTLPPAPSSRVVRTPSSLPPPTVGGPPHFALFGIPVRVGIGFWVMSFLLGIQGGPQSALVWTVVVFVSVLLHEMGHALMARRFGARPAITLHAMGGVTTYRDVGMSRPRRVLVSLAGPGAGLLLGLVVFLAARQVSLADGQLTLVNLVLWVNVGWGLINLMPVLPFDGGKVLDAALGPRRAFATALVSAIVGGGVAIAGGLWLRSIWIMVLFGMAAASALTQARLAWSNAIDARAGLERQLGEAKAALARGALDDAYVLADDIVRRARTAPVRNAGWTALAWVHVARNEGQLARQALVHLEPRNAIDPYTLAAVEDSAGDPRRARDILEEARRHGMTSLEMSKLLIDLYARDGRINQAVELAAQDIALLDRGDLRAVRDAAFGAGEFRGAADLSSRLFQLHGEATDLVEAARAHARLGDRETAIAGLERAAGAPGVELRKLAGDPDFEALMGDERLLRLYRAHSG